MADHQGRREGWGVLAVPVKAHALDQAVALTPAHDGRGQAAGTDPHPLGGSHTVWRVSRDSSDI